MFSEQQFYEGKVFLRSYKDALDCLKDAAEKQSYLDNYNRMAERILQAKNDQSINEVDGQFQKRKNFLNSYEVRLFQFSNYVFKKYLPGFDQYQGDFTGLKQILNDASQNLKQDLEKN